MDVLPFIVEITKAAVWPAVLLVALFAFRKIITKKLDDLIEIHKEGKTFRALFNPPQPAAAALPTPGQTVLSPEDVRNTLKRVRFLKPEDVDKEYVRAHIAFIQRGIVTQQQLDQLVSSDAILKTLAQVYIEEFGRSLDPVAVAVYGSILYGRGMDDSIINAIRMDIRHSPEYQKSRKTS
jgi:hypothetical protein